MNLRKKKKLAVRVLNIGVDRISFSPERLDEIKEAITNQDIRDLVKSKAIIIKDKKGRKTIEKRKKRSFGKIKKKVNKRKQEYVIFIRKLRWHLKNLKKNKKISNEDYKKLRIQIKARTIKSKAHLMEIIKTE